MQHDGPPVFEDPPIKFHFLRCTMYDDEAAKGHQLDPPPVPKLFEVVNMFQTELMKADAMIVSFRGIAQGLIPELDMECIVAANTGVKQNAPMMHAFLGCSFGDCCFVSFHRV